MLELRCPPKVKLFSSRFFDLEAGPAKTLQKETRAGTLRCGDEIKTNKNRWEVISIHDVDANVEGVYGQMCKTGVAGVLVSQFRDCVAALVFKDKSNRNSNIDLPGVIKASTTGRRTESNVAAVVGDFFMAPLSYGNVHAIYKEDDKMPFLKTRARSLKTALQMNCWQRTPTQRERKTTRKKRQYRKLC